MIRKHVISLARPLPSRRRRRRPCFPLLLLLLLLLPSRGRLRLAAGGAAPRGVLAGHVALQGLALVLALVVAGQQVQQRACKASGRAGVRCQPAQTARQPGARPGRCRSKRGGWAGVAGGHSNGGFSSTPSEPASNAWRAAADRAPARPRYTTGM